MLGAFHLQGHGRQLLADVTAPLQQKWHCKQAKGSNSDLAKPVARSGMVPALANLANVQGSARGDTAGH